MNSHKDNNNSNHLSEYWTKLDKRVLKAINDKVVAYKNEIELSLELEGYRHRDIGVSIKWLSEEAPVIYLDTKKLTIQNTDYTFFFFRKKKTELVNLVLEKKKKILERYQKKSEKFGTWAHNNFYPRVLNNLGFILEGISTNYYNLVKIEGDYDVITSAIRNCNAKIFIDIKNRLTVYRNKDLFKFFQNLSNFNFEIIPIVIARKIYEDPKDTIKKYNGDFIEMGKIIVQEKYKEISKNFNTEIANISRVIPDRLIPQDITKQFKNLLKLKDGINFNKAYRRMGSL